MITGGPIYLNLANTELIKVKLAKRAKRQQKIPRRRKMKEEEEEEGKQFHNNKKAGDGSQLMSL